MLGFKTESGILKNMFTFNATPEICKTIKCLGGLYKVNNAYVLRWMEEVKNCIYSIQYIHIYMDYHIVI